MPVFGKGVQASASVSSLDRSQESKSFVNKLDRPAILRRTLDNGLTILIQEDHSHPLVSFYAVVKTGSATEGPYLGAGISHLVEHMLFKGTPRRPVGKVEQEARSYGGSSQGYTTYDTTSYPLTVNQERWKQAADLLIDCLFHPTMDPGEFAKERDVVIRELKLGKDDPDHLIWDLLFHNAFRQHPYRIPIIGYEEQVKAITREDVVEYHKTHYLPNNMTLGIVGDIQAQAILEEIERLTAEIPPGRVILRALPKEPLPVEVRDIRQEADVNLCSIAVGFHSVGVADSDLFALDLMAWLLGGGRGSRLDLALKESGIVHSVSAWNYTPLDGGLFVVSMRSDPPKVEEALKVLHRELEQVQKRLFDSEEIGIAKRNFLREHFSTRQTVGGMASDLASNEALVGDPLFDYRYVEGVSQVTAEELKRVAQVYFQPERATQVVLYPKGTLPMASHQQQKASFQATVEEVVLQNGVRVLLKRDLLIPLVTVQVSMMGGVRLEEEKNNGVSGIMARMLLRGTPKKNAEQIADGIKSLGSELAPFSGRNSFGLSLEIMKDRADEGLSLLTELLLESIFPVEELEKERRLALAEIKAREEDPFSWGIRRLAALLFEKHPYRMDPSGTEASIQALTREAVVNFYGKGLEPSRMVISVVGDFDRQTILSSLEKTVGQLSPGQKLPVLPQESRLNNLKERVELTRRQEGLLMIGFQGMKITDPEIPVMDVLEAVLSGGAGRLFSEVREKRGLAYTVGAFGIPGIDPGGFVLYAVTEPAQLKVVKEAILAEIQRMSTILVPEEELQEAKNGLLGAKRIARQTQAATAMQMSQDELFGLGYDYPERYEARIKAVTAAEIQKVAREWLDISRCVILLARPEEGNSPRQTQLRRGNLAEVAKTHPK